MHSVEFLSIYGLRAESNERIRNIKGPLNASVGGGFWRVEALKQPNPNQVPGRGGWFIKHQQKEAIAEPPVPPVGMALRARLESQVPGICAGAMLYCLVRQIRPKDMTTPIPAYKQWLFPRDGNI